MPTEIPANEPLLDTAQASTFLGGRSVPTLEKDRVSGTGPRFIKIGRLVKYRPSDLRDFIAERVRQSTSGHVRACRKAKSARSTMPPSDRDPSPGAA